MRKISSHTEILFEPIRDFLTEEWNFYDSLFPNVYNLWRTWLETARSDDRGYSYLCEPYVGTRASLDKLYEGVKEKAIMSSEVIPSTKPELGIIDDIDKKIIKKLDENIRGLEKRLLEPDKWAEVTNLISSAVMYVFYKGGASAYRYDLIYKGKKLRDVISEDLVPHLDVFVETWNGSFPKPNMIYRMAYVCADACQPEDQQIFPSIKPSSNIRKSLGPQQVRDMILRTPEAGVRYVILEGDSYDEIRQNQIEITERKLCPAALFKTRAPKEKVEDYLERIKNQYPELYGSRIKRFYSKFRTPTV